VSHRNQNAHARFHWLWPDRWSTAAAFVLFTPLLTIAAEAPTVPGQPSGPARGQVIRCAVIGGMMDTDFWPELVRRFEKASGHRVEVVAEGPKRVIAKAFVAGKADLITMHASDTVINLVADGYGIDPQPWARNDLLLVGPPEDPAGIRGEQDAVRALEKIIATKSKLLFHSSLGANEVLSDLLAAGNLQPDPQRTIMLPPETGRELLRRASQEKAYVLVGRIPFLNGKIPSGGLQIMVQGDPRMRRPYVVTVAVPKSHEDPRYQAARLLARFLRDRETQDWIAGFGRGKLDERPLFFPVVPQPASAGP
jgi:tungstate transport system substrate-binding protein